MCFTSKCQADDHSKTTICDPKIKCTMTAQTPDSDITGHTLFSMVNQEPSKLPRRRAKDCIVASSPSRGSLAQKLKPQLHFSKSYVL